MGPFERPELYIKWWGSVHFAKLKGERAQVEMLRDSGQSVLVTDHKENVTVDRTKSEHISFHTILSIRGKYELLEQKEQ